MLMDTNGNTKKLLIKDLSSRLPYGVKVNGVFLTYDKDKDKILYKECVKELNYSHLSRYWTLKPYLFPLSSMAEEQSKVYHELIRGMFGTSALINFEVLIDFFNSNHLDYRGLIKMGLAVDATGLNIY